MRCSHSRCTKRAEHGYCNECMEAFYQKKGRVGNCICDRKARKALMLKRNQEVL